MIHFLEKLGEFLFGILLHCSGPCLAPAGVSAAIPGTERGEPGSIQLFNTGGPRSRTRRETISASLFPEEGRRSSVHGLRRIGKIWALRYWGQSLRQTALEILDELGFADPDEAFGRLHGIPRRRLHCRPCKPRSNYEGAARVDGDRRDYLRKALVLGKCRSGLYDPNGPVIWTEKRLEQWLELYEIRHPFFD